VRPLLKPALRRLWRDPATLQLGLDPRYAVALAGLGPADSDLLDALDGTRTTAELIAAGERRGRPAARTAELLHRLGEAGAIEDAAGSRGPADPRHEPDLRSLSLTHPGPGAAHAVLTARASVCVEIFGAGRIGAGVAMLLAAAGVGRLALRDAGPLRPADLAPGGVRGPGAQQGNRADALRAALAVRPGRAGTGRHEPAGTPALAVLAPTGSVVPPEWLQEVRHRAHLPVTIRETTALIGPLVVPGRTPCVRCLELARGDRDPVWPVLAAQLVGTPDVVEPCDVALAGAAASITALHVLAWLDRGEAAPPPSSGGIVELSLDDLRLRRRTVLAHPGCGCGAAEPSAEPQARLVIGT